MIDENTKRNLNDIPILDKPQTYIYLMLNSAGKLKIGKTRNIQQRYQSLCGSNGQGNHILKVYCSKGTYVSSIETTMHNTFSRYRIAGTEWFFDNADQSGERLYCMAKNELDALFSSTGYKKCNELREKMYVKSKGGDTYDN